MGTDLTESAAPPCAPAPRWATWLCAALLCVGVVSRAVVAPQTPGIIHPDEHQQYVEQAFGLVHGYCASFWEYERGIRHYLYPGLLAGALYVLEGVGIDDPLAQTALLRFALSVGVLGRLALFAWRWLKEGKVAAAICLTGVAALTPDMHHATLRTLSETAASLPLLLAFYVLGTRPFVAGLLLGLMFGVRFQCAFFIVGLAPVLVFQDGRKLMQGGSWKQSRALWVGAGLALALLGVGLIDKLTWGSWFHSPIEYVRSNIFEGKAASFGVQPWSYYFERLTQGEYRGAIVLLAIAAIAAVRRWELALPIFVFVLGHVLVGHKEIRFLLPAVPLLLILLSLAVDDLGRWLARPWFQYAAAGALLALLVVGSFWRSTRIDWTPEPSSIAMPALAWLGAQEDLEGVVVAGIDEANSGNYFYLRRDVPLRYVAVHNLHRFQAQQRSEPAKFNYVLARPEYLPYFDRVELREVQTFGEFHVYRCKRVQLASK